MNIMSVIPSAMPSAMPSLASPDREIFQQPGELICLRIDPVVCSPEVIVGNLASIEGPVDVYFWYEGPRCLPKRGADFMKEFIFKPLYKLKQDAKLCLYSLKAWNFEKALLDMPLSTPLGESINRINKAAVECIYSSAFFQYCTTIHEKKALYEFISAELPKKNWLFSLSENKKKQRMTISELFNNQSSLFDCINDLDLSAAYSPMQYIEGYYLIQESIKRGLLNGQKKIQIAFVLPNDESKYYVDYPKDIEKMLKLDFGRALSTVEINISFQFFEYEDLASRPYLKPYVNIDKRSQAPSVKIKEPEVRIDEIDSYFRFLSQPLFSEQQQPTMPFLRDVIHNINGWY